jgi:hypothetical protein
MITKEELKKEVDRLPENLLEEVYSLLKRLTQAKKTPLPLTVRNFKGKLDHSDLRKSSYE